MAVENPEKAPVFKDILTGYNSLTRIHLINYKSSKNLPALQKFWREDEDQEWKPGKAITFHYEAIEDVIQGLTDMKSWLEEHPNA